MEAVQTAILDRMRRSRRMHVFTPKDLADFAGRSAIDQALSRLTRGGQLQRVGRGLYYLPRQNPRLGIAVPPDLDELARAVGRQTGSRVVPSGAVAANRLGLSTQVPAKPLYLSDGRTRRVRVGGTEILVKHVSPKELPSGRPRSAMVFQALRHLGPGSVNDKVVEALQRALSAKERSELAEDARYTTDWIADTVRRVAGRERAGHG